MKPPLDVESKLAKARRWIVGLEIGAMFVLGLFHVAFTWPKKGTYPKELVTLFHLDREGNLPAWFASTQFFILGFTLFALAVVASIEKKRRDMMAWGVAAMAAIFLAADETAQIHETMGTLMKLALEGAEPGTFWATVRAFPGYYWVLIYVPLFVPACIFFFVFMWRRLANNRLLLAVGVGIFVVSAAALDFVEGHFGTSNHTHLKVSMLGSAYLIDTFLIEEMGEMLGVCLVTLAFLRPLSARVLALAASTRTEREQA